MTGSTERSPLDATSRRSFWKYFSASTISNMGDGVTAIAIPLVALQVLNASNFEIGLLTAASYAAVVLIGLPAGVIVQSFELRRLQVSLDVFRAAALATVPLAVWWDILTIVHLFSVAFLVGLANNISAVANATYLPQVVPRNQLIERNGLISGSHAATQTLGPAGAGLLTQVVGAAGAIVVDTVSYLVSALLFWRIPATPKLPVPAGAPGYFRQVVDGMRYLVRHPVLRPCASAATAANFANGAILATLAPFVVRQLGFGPAALGVVSSPGFDGELVSWFSGVR
ncbi:MULTISPECIES: MFS transporter [unclassified Micromonospora]|uniref:MFS transporter n=1 Tax=unclassified Micromonospora TaxID=2617518 RepID=UPI003A8C00DF